MSYEPNARDGRVRAALMQISEGSAVTFYAKYLKRQEGTPMDETPDCESSIDRAIRIADGIETLPARYNHAYTIAFEVESACPEGSDVTDSMLAVALRKRVEDCTTGKDADLSECCGAPFDTYELES